MDASVCTLNYHDYKYLPYERHLAQKEIASFLKGEIVSQDEKKCIVSGRFTKEALKRLVYFKNYEISGKTHLTTQYIFEQANGPRKRQSTRYSVHGMHEYKGKFNPQIVRWLLNHLHLDERTKVLDPFCGSGTSLIECAHYGIPVTGCDVNPLAVFIANAKVSSLSCDTESLARHFGPILRGRHKVIEPAIGESARDAYLKDWFPVDTLIEAEQVRKLSGKIPARERAILLTLVSDLLRDYSLQEPADLRIRRRNSPFPSTSFTEALSNKIISFISNLASSRAGSADATPMAKAYHCDSRVAARTCRTWQVPPPFNAAITSPPYATALPYIDTQRLSLVWLGLCAPGDIHRQDSELTGSREIGTRGKAEWLLRLTENTDMLPRTCAALCRELYHSLRPSDGFRKRAVPVLLYRYLSDMKKMFSEIALLLRKHAPFALVVGQNRTTLGGTAFAIDTPRLLGELAASAGWDIDGLIPLQAYRRFGLHSANAVREEALLILRRL